MEIVGYISKDIPLAVIKWAYSNQQNQPLTATPSAGDFSLLRQPADTFEMTGLGWWVAPALGR